MANVKEAQIRYVLSRSCLYLPKLMYILRTVNLAGHTELWEEFDQITKSRLTTIIAAPLLENLW